ncbi:MAG: permease-like cell division protein FtsX [candidate division WOR-3 bacterium]
MKETLRAIKVGSYRSIFTIIGISLSLLSLFILSNLLMVSYGIYRNVREGIRFEIFPDGDPEDAVKKLRLLGGIKSVEMVSGEKARKEFLKYYPDFERFLEDLGDDIFYTIIRVYPRNHWKEPEFLDMLYEKIKSIKGVSGVYYGKSWLSSADAFFKTILSLTVGVIVITILITLSISFYTVRFVVSHRKNYVDILRLSGVSPFKLRYPYILLSILYATISWVIASLISIYILQNLSLLTKYKTENLLLFIISLIVVVITCALGSIRALRDIEMGIY